MADEKAPSTYRLQITNHTVTPRGIHEVGKLSPTMIPAKGGSGFVTVDEGTKNQLVAMDDDALFLVYVLEKDGKSLGKRQAPAAQSRAEREAAARAAAPPVGQAAPVEPQKAAGEPEKAEPAPIGNPTAFLLSKGMPQSEIDALGDEDEIAARAEGLGWTRPAAGEGEDEAKEFDETQFDDYDADTLRAYLNGQGVEFHPQTGETKLRAKALEHARKLAAEPPAEEAV